MKKADRPPYPVTGFLSFYEKLNEAMERTPQSIDEADFDLSRSGGELMLQTFRAYGLVEDDSNRVTPFFKQLAVSDEPTRRQMLRHRASELFEHFISMMQRDAGEAEVVESLDLLYGIQGSTAIKMVNHYNGASLFLRLPRSEALPVMRGYKNVKVRPRVMPKRPASALGVGTPADVVHRVEERPVVEDVSPEVGETSNDGALKRDTLARHYKMQAEYAELLLRALRNTVEHGDVPTEELLARIDRFVGARQAELPSPSIQGGTG